MALFLATGAGLALGGGVGFVAGRKKQGHPDDSHHPYSARNVRGSGEVYRARDEENEYKTPSGWPSTAAGSRGSRPPVRRPPSPRSDAEVCRVLANNNKGVDALIKHLEDRSGTVSVDRFREAVDNIGLAFRDEEIAGLTSSRTGTISLGELQARYKHGSRKYVQKFQVGSSLSKMASFVLIGVPVVCMSLAVVFGGILAWLEAWPFKECFFLMLMEMGDLDIHLDELGDDHERIPDSDLGRLVAALVGCVSVAIFGGILAVMGGPLLHPFLVMTRMEVYESEPHPIRKALTKLAFLIGVLLPLSAIVISVIFGGLLAAIEDWPFRNTFYAVLGEIIDSKIALTHLKKVQPTNDVARLVWAIIGLWSLVTFATVIGVVAGPIMNPILEVLRLTPVEPQDGPENEDSRLASRRPPPTQYPPSGTKEADEFFNLVPLDGELLVPTSRPDGKGS